MATERNESGRPADQQGVTLFAVTLRNKQAFEDLVTRVNAAGVAWMSPPDVHTDPALSAKIGGKLADPSGNVINVKYEDIVEPLPYR